MTFGDRRYCVCVRARCMGISSDFLVCNLNSEQALASAFAGCSVCGMKKCLSCCWSEEERRMTSQGSAAHKYCQSRASLGISAPRMMETGGLPRGTAGRVNGRIHSCNFVARAVAAVSRCVNLRLLLLIYELWRQCKGCIILTPDTQLRAVNRPPRL